MALVTQAAFHLYLANALMGLANCVIMRYNTFLTMTNDVNRFILGVFNSRRDFTNIKGNCLSFRKDHKPCLYVLFLRASEYAYWNVVECTVRNDSPL